MTIKNIDPIESYPENYDSLGNEYKEKIITLMNIRQKVADEYWRICKDSYEDIEDEELDEYKYTFTTLLDKELNERLAAYNAAINFLSGMRIAYASLGIKVEYNWPNHKDEWFLATREDAENYENAEETQEDPPVTQNVLLHYGDVGI